MHCTQCGTQVDPQAIFCQQCGTRLAEPAPGDAASPESAFQAGAAPRRDDPEEELWTGGYSSKAMLGTWLLAGMGTIAGCVVGALTGVLLFVAIGLVVLWVALWLRLIVRQLNVGYRLTSQRFFHKRGILRQVTDRIEVIDMDDITWQQGPIERLVNVGTVRITSSDLTHPEIELDGIDDVARVAQMLDDARRAERLRRGLHIEAV